MSEEKKSIGGITPNSDELTGFTTSIRIPKIQWLPQEDISAYELAQAQSALIMMATGHDPAAVEAEIMGYTESVSRHFRIE